MKKVVLSSSIALLVLFVSFRSSDCQEASPPAPGDCITRASPRHDGDDRAFLNAVLVKSWFFLGSAASAWEELNTEWPLYGSVPIHVYTKTLADVDTFTYQDLVDSGADVLILSDPAGGLKQYSSSEIDAIEQYAAQGHNVIGTYLLYYYDSQKRIIYDNRGLAPIFGMRSDIDYADVVNITNRFHQIDPYSPLFTFLADPWISAGWPNSQTPADDHTWDDIDLAGAMMKAECDSYTAMISLHDGGSYTGIYISNMPEFNGTSNDKQLLYNAIIYTPGFRLAVEPFPLVSGLNGTFTVSGGNPDTMTFLAYSLTGTGSTYIPQLAVFIDLSNPFRANGPLKTNSLGGGSWDLLIPPAGAGRDVWFQALQFQNKTNMVSAWID